MQTHASHLIIIFQQMQLTAEHDSDTVT